MELMCLCAGVRGWLVRRAYAPVFAHRQQAALQIQKSKLSCDVLLLKQTE